MKVSMEGDRYIIYFHLKEEKEIDFTDKEELEKYFRKLFLKLKKYYNIELFGYYNIDVYHNEYYGAVIEIEKEDYEYYEYFEDKLDMRISVVCCESFLYKVENMVPEIKKYPMYQYKGDLYVQVNEKLSSIEMGKILENSTLIYDEQIEDILTFGKSITENEAIL